MLELRELIKQGDPQKIAKYMKEVGLTVIDGKIVPIKEKMDWAKGQIMFWNQRQQARKILLNSLYGALLNEAMRLADPRMGQSVTLTGRSIVRHMNSQINQVLTSSYDYTGPAIKYADTDSCYFSPLVLRDDDKLEEWRASLFSALHEQEKNILADQVAKDVPEKKRTQIIYDKFDFDNRDHIVRLCDDVADLTNSTFPKFMNETFNTSLERGGIIAAGRELVASRMLFIKKKKYGGLVYDDEGKRLDIGNKPGKLKAMGLDLKRADTPKFMQTFLQEILMDVLLGAGEHETIAKIKDFRVRFKDRPAWEKGSPKKVSNLTKYGAILNRAASMGLTDHRKRNEKAKAAIPGHVRASLNWNNLLDQHGDKHSMRITDGSRIIVCKLLPNVMKMDSVAYPMDEPHIPQWFKELPFDHATMENVIIDKKMLNLIGPMNWDLRNSYIFSGDEFFVF